MQTKMAPHSGGSGMVTTDINGHRRRAAVADERAP